jgi:hypothetical protein
VNLTGFGWTNASYQVGLTYITNHMRRALSVLTNPESFSKEGKLTPLPSPAVNLTEVESSIRGLKLDPAKDKSGRSELERVNASEGEEDGMREGELLRPSMGKKGTSMFGRELVKEAEEAARRGLRRGTVREEDESDH